MSLSLEQSTEPAPEPCYVLIVHMGFPTGGFRYYKIVDEHARSPKAIEHYVGPFKSHQDAVQWAVEDLKILLPEAYARLMSQRSTEGVLIKANGALFLKPPPGIYQGVINELVVSVFLTIPEYDEATRDLPFLDPDGVV